MLTLSEAYDAFHHLHALTPKTVTARRQATAQADALVAAVREAVAAHASDWEHLARLLVLSPAIAMLWKESHDA